MKLFLIFLLCMAEPSGCIELSDNDIQSKGINKFVASKVVVNISEKTGDVVFILNNPPEKSLNDLIPPGVGDSQVKANIAEYFTPLLKELKKRDPVVAAQEAYLHGERYLFWDQYGVIKNDRGNSIELTAETLKVCSEKKRLEGTHVIYSCHGVDVCGKYSGLSHTYSASWNQEMVKLCKEK